MMSELWKNIPGFPGYSASNLGNIKSEARTIIRSNGKKQTFKERVLKSTPTKHLGRRTVNIRCSKGKVGARFVYHLVMLAFKGPTPSNKFIRHKNGIESDDKLTNLKFTTPKRNSQDRVCHATEIIGVRRWQSKFTLSDIYIIRQLYTSGITISRLAEEYKVAYATIKQIITFSSYNPETWVKHIKAIHKEYLREPKKERLKHGLLLIEELKVLDPLNSNTKQLVKLYRK